jgi:transcriptional regulator with XRE-family HTH domain
MVDMAKMLHKPYRTYQNWELGVVSPKNDDMIVLANLLKVDPGWLEFGDKPKLADSTRALIEEYFPKEQK